MKLKDWLRGRAGAAAAATVTTRNKTNTDPAQVPDGPAAERVTTQEADMPAPETTVGSAAKTEATTAPNPPAPLTPVTVAPPGAESPVASAEAPATLAELKADFGDDAAFMVECLEKNRSLLAAHRIRNAQLSAKAAGLAKLGTAGLGGATPVGAAGPASAGGAEEDTYEKMVQRVSREKNISIAAATTEVNRTHPQLREKYVGRNGKRTHAAV
jgi:hypothetical protein